MPQGRIQIVSFEDLPTKAAEILKKKKIVVKKVAKKPRYSNKKNQLILSEDYNLLRLQLILRPYFCRKYNTPFGLLELLLYLYPLNFFAQADYSKLPKSFSYKQVMRMVDLKYFVIVVEGKNVAQNVYGLSRSSKKIVEDYYKYLSGEKKFEYIENNKLDPTGIEIKRLQIIKSLAESPLEPMTKYFQ